MIYDTLASETANILATAFPVFRQALEWIGAYAEKAPVGITELKGRDLYVNVHGYDTSPVEDCIWESHRHTVDLQYCIRGGERISWTTGQSLQAKGVYMPEKDTQNWIGSASAVTDIMMVPGTFAVFFPGELHRPKINDGRNNAVHKLVVKINADLVGL